MQQTADVEILWITVDVAAECLPAYGSFFSSAAVADGDAMSTDVDVEMTAACGSSFFSAAVAALAMDAAMDADGAMVTTAVCGSSFFSAAAAALAMDAVMVAATAVDVDARQLTFSCIGLKRRSHFPVSFFIYIYNADTGRSHHGRKTF